MAKVTFGNKQAWVLCNLDPAARLDLIAEGLPKILQSAEGFWAAAVRLAGTRESRVLEGFAEEEAAKILILMDLVRCPSPRVAQTCGAVIRTYYSHLGRLIYADAQGWKPVNVRELRSYVDKGRRAHGLEGYAGEIIMPNWSRYARESAMYADIEVHENGIPIWNQPHVFGSGGPTMDEPLVLRLARALDAVGAFTRRGIQAVSDVWSSKLFTDAESYDDNRRLVQQLIERLESEGLVRSHATPELVRPMQGYWQLPMYDLDFRELPVPLEDLKAEQEAALWAEIGHYPDYY